MASNNQPNTFAEAHVGLHAKLLSALQSLSAAAASGPASGSNGNASHGNIAPTPLLVRVLRRTAADFADVIVDGRCATGSRQVGSAAAVWVHHNAAARSAGGTSPQSSPATVPATSAAGGGLSTSPTSTAAAAAATNSPTSITPLYHTEAAINECRSLLALYAMHCLLTASDLYNSSVHNSNQRVHAGADGRVRQLPMTASQWAPEVAIIVAETEAAAEELVRACRALVEACSCGVQVSLALGSKSPASLIVRPMPAGGAAASSTGGNSGGAAKGDANAGKKEEERRKGTECPCAASILVTTTHSFLNWNLTTLLNTGVDVAIAEEESEAEGSKDKDAPPRTRRVYPHVTAVVVEEIARAATSANSEKVIQQWRDVHNALGTAMPRQHTRYCSAAHLLPHFLWICRGPISRLPSSLRQLLSRRSRRYYQLQPSTYVSSAAVALMPHPQEGLSTPAESLGIRLVLSQNANDKDAQLRRIVTDRSGLYHRVLVLTHNKEVPQLNTLIASWGVSRDYPSTTVAANSAAATQMSMSASSPNLVHATRRMDSLVAQQQCHASYLGCCDAAERVTATDASASQQPSDDAPSPVVVSLVAWDAFTALDVMDVDVIVQYYPPQKSLTEQEWAEFIQLLHTTVDGEREIELSLRQNRNNKEDNIRAKLSQLMQSTTTFNTTSTTTATTSPTASTAEAQDGTAAKGAASPSASPSPARASASRPLPVLITLMVAADFTLTAYFLHQYLYSGGSGSLTAAATASSLASITSLPGKPGVQEPIEHPTPVLDISPRHPYFIPLVCGHAGGAEWPETAPGAPPRPREAAPSAKAGDAPLLTHFATGEAVNIRNVLVAKLAKERGRGDGAAAAAATTATGASSPVMLLAQGNVSLAGSSPTSGGGGNSGAAAAGASASGSGNLARTGKGGAATGSGGSANGNGAAANSSGTAGRFAGSGSGGGRDGAGVNAAAAGSSGGGGNKSSGNAQRSSNSGASGGGGGRGGKGANSSSTASSVAAPGTAALGGSGGGGQTDTKSSTPSTSTPSPKSVNEEKAGGSGGGGGGGRRRVRSGRNSNANASGSGGKKA